MITGPPPKFHGTRDILSGRGVQPPRRFGEYPAQPLAGALLLTV